MASPQKPTEGLLFDLRRKAQLANAGPADHAGEVIVRPMEIDLEKTIFKTVDEGLKPMVRAMFGKEMFWSDQAVDKIETQTSQLLAENKNWSMLKAHNPALINFMENECDFNTEHADGSFLDHLQYCYEYGTAHFSTASPVPLFLHSIMGVGTNLFPMKLEQRPQLQQLVSEDDLAHIEAFPTVLRLLQSRRLMDKLLGMSNEELECIDELECCRLLGPDMDNVMRSDNAPVKLTGKQFWAHLNYQLIHLIDFLPVEEWNENAGQMRTFSDLHGLLTRANKLMCNLNFDSMTWSAEAAKQSELTQSMSQSFSQKIGHSLDFKLKVMAVARARL
jgi:hypothetical protein